MHERHVARFAVDAAALDAAGELALPALAGYLQDAAARHADALGCGLEALRARGWTWVLARQRVEVAAAPTLGDVLEVETWPSGADRLFAWREFVVTRAGVEVARASTAWLVLDVAARRPVRPAEVLPAHLVLRREAVAPVPARLPAPADGAEGRTFAVRPEDIDVNEHANNTAYVGWALACVDAGRLGRARASALEVHYLAEARLGDVVSARLAGEGDALVHALARAGDGEELARLRTRWVPR